MDEILSFRLHEVIMTEAKRTLVKRITGQDGTGLAELQMGKVL